MVKIAAIGSYEGAVAGGDAAEAAAKLEALLAGKGSGDILTADEAAAVKECLAAIGADKAEWSVDDAWIGEGACEYAAAGAGIEVAAAFKAGVEQAMDRNRMLWNVNIAVAKAGGEAEAQKIAWAYRIVSFGTNDVTGEPCIIFDRAYDRVVKDDVTLAKFNAGEAVSATRMDFTAFKQWGLYAAAKCAVTTAEGTVEF